MQFNDLATNVAILFVLIAVAGGVFVSCLNSLSGKLFSWAFLSGVKKGYQGDKRKKKVTSAELIERGDAYVKRPSLLTEPEKILFKVLQHKYGETHHVFCQVRVVDVIQPNANLYKERSREWMALFRQVSQWHFDFVICEKETLEVVRVIELDDASHKQKERIRRDRVMECVCHSANIVLERLDLNVLISTVRYS